MFEHKKNQEVKFMGYAEKTTVNPRLKVIVGKWIKNNKHNNKE